MCVCPEQDQLCFLQWKEFLLLFLSETTFFSFYTDVYEIFQINVHVLYQLKKKKKIGGEHFTEHTHDQALRKAKHV